MSFNSYHLKYIALITMIIDHSALVFRDMLSSGAYLFLRCIGRTAFPIFCFLLVEGFFHTGSRQRYLSRLVLFSILSEIPFDFVLYGSGENGLPYFMDFGHQNVFFTLALGFAAMMFLEQYKSNKSFYLAGILVPVFLADILGFDYGALGIITILLFYFHHKYPRFPLCFCLIPLMCTSIVQALCICSMIFLYLYNGEKGHGQKYLFYVAYPVHLLLLYFIHQLW